MAIIVPAGPPEGRQIVERHLSNLGLGGDPGRGFVTEAGGNLSTPAPIPLWRIGIGDLASGPAAAMDAAHHVGWQYIITSDGPASIVEISNEAHVPKVLSLIRDGAGEQLGATSRLAEQVANPNRDFEARVLDLRDVGQMFLWLHANYEDDIAFDLGDDQARPIELGTALEAAGLRARQKLDAAYGGDGFTEIGGT